MEDITIQKTAKSAFVFKDVNPFADVLHPSSCKFFRTPPLYALVDL